MVSAETQTLSLALAWAVPTTKAAAESRLVACDQNLVDDHDGALALTRPAAWTLRLAVAMAVSSGAVRLEAAALVSDAAEPDPGELAAVRDLGPDAPVFHAAPDGTLRATLVPETRPRQG